MANHVQALKRYRQSVKHQERNRARKSAMKTAVRNVREAIAAGKIEEANKLLQSAVKVIRKTASAGVIHSKQADRRVSRLVKAFNKANTPAA